LHFQTDCIHYFWSFAADPTAYQDLSILADRDPNGRVRIDSVVAVSWTGTGSQPTIRKIAFRTEPIKDITDIAWLVAVVDVAAGIVNPPVSGYDCR
jgi:hypothetical protein